jgi:hypothetical protein
MGGATMAKGVLIAAMDFSNVPAVKFNDWYDTEHIPERQQECAIKAHFRSGAL